METGSHEVLHIGATGECTPEQVPITGVGGSPHDWRVRVDRQEYRPAVFHIHPDSVVWVVMRPVKISRGSVEVDALTLIGCNSAVLMCTRSPEVLSPSLSTSWDHGDLFPHPIGPGPDFTIGPPDNIGCDQVPDGWGTGGAAGEFDDDEIESDSDFSTDDATDDETGDATLEETLETMSEVDEDDDQDNNGDPHDGQEDLTSDAFPGGGSASDDDL